MTPSCRHSYSFRHLLIQKIDEHILFRICTFQKIDKPVRVFIRFFLFNSIHSAHFSLSFAALHSSLVHFISRSMRITVWPIKTPPRTLIRTIKSFREAGQLSTYTFGDEKKKETKSKHQRMGRFQI